MAENITNSKLGQLIMAFFFIIIGITLLTQVADSQVAATTLNTNFNDEVTLLVVSGTSTAEDITLSSLSGTVATTRVTNITFFGNTTINTSIGSITVGAEVNFTTTGIITASGANFTDGDYSITYTYVANGTSAVKDDDTQTLIFFGNRTVNTSIGSISIGTEVNLSRNGSLAVSTLNFTAGAYNTTYTFESDQYVVDSTSRTLMGLLTIFFAIGVISIGIGFGLKAFTLI